MPPESINDIFVTRLKDLLSVNHMTYSELAQKIGVSKSTVSMWVSKKSMPRMDLLEKIANVFAVAPDDLLKSSLTLGERIHNTRIERCMSLHELSERTGLSKFSIQRYEAGDSNISLEKLEKIADALNISTKELLGIAVTTYEPKSTLAAHFDGDEYTEEELNEIRQFAEFIKSKRRAAPPDQDEPETLNAANDRGATPEEKKNADDIMHDPDEWE